MTIWEARTLGVKKLQNSQNSSQGRILFSTPSLDCDCLLSHILGKDRTFLVAHNQDFLDSDDERDYLALIEKRAEGTPVAYLVEKKEFYGYDFFVNKSVLIPKPDTEIAVEKTIEIIERAISKCGDSFCFADICTGSGCIAIAILKTILKRIEAKNLTCHCVDISKDALEVAQKNAHLLLGVEGLSCIQFFEGDLLSPLKMFGTYDVIVSNPPYVPSSVVDNLLKDGRGEPRLALDGDVDNELSQNGLSVIERLVPQVWGSLKSGGFFIIETGEYNASKTLEIMEDLGFVDCVTYEDLAGLPRVSCGRKP